MPDATTLAEPSVAVNVPSLINEVEPVSIAEPAGDVNKVLGVDDVRSILATEVFAVAVIVTPLAERAKIVAIDAASRSGDVGTAAPTGAATAPVRILAVADTTALVLLKPEALIDGVVRVAKIPPIPMPAVVLEIVKRKTFALLAVAVGVVSVPGAAVVVPTIDEPIDTLAVVSTVPRAGVEMTPAIEALVKLPVGAVEKTPPVNSIITVTVEPAGIATPLTILIVGANTAAPGVEPRNCSLAYVNAEADTEVTAEAEPIITIIADATAV